MNKIFNWKISLLSVTSFGIITFVVNVNGLLLFALLAAFKEMIFRFFWAGFLGRLMQSISDKYNGINPYVLSAVIPTILVFILTYAMHYFTFTPYPLRTVAINSVVTLFSGVGTMALFKKNLMKV